MLMIWMWALLLPNSYAIPSQNALPSPGALGSLYIQNGHPLHETEGSVIDGVLTLGSYNFFGGPQADRQALLPSLAIDAKAFGRGSIVEGGAKLQAQAFFSQNVPYYVEVPEAYLSLSKNLTRFQIALGRKQEQWSRVDEFWKLGIWQPRFRWDYLEPQQVGLIGGFLKATLPWVTLDGFFSPIYIPERGAPIFFNNGTVTSPGPFFIAPSPTVRFEGADVATLYELKTPDLGQVLMHPGAGLQARFGKPAGPGFQGPWGSLGYAYKPMNQLLMGTDGKLKIDYVKATLYPRVLYHHLTSLEAGMETEWTAVWVSFLDERPVGDKPDSNWRIIQQVVPGTTVSATLEWKMGRWFHDQARVGLSYLRQWGGNAPDGGDVTGSSSLFEYRYPFQNAVSLGVRSPMFGERLGASARMIYDFSLAGLAISTDAQYSFLSGVRLSLGFDVLGSALPNSAPEFGSDLFSRFRGNNRIRAGVSYVF